MKASFRKMLCLVAVICLMAVTMVPASFADGDIGFPEKSTITLVVPGKPAADPIWQSVTMLRH